MTDLFQGWKLVTKGTGATSNGFHWPVTDLPAKVQRSPDQTTPYTTYSACPDYPGDGFCLAKTMKGACSGGLRVADTVGLVVTYSADDVLHDSDPGKLRVKRCTVVGTFDPLELIRAGLVPNLTGANLRWADLTGADLTGADLRWADLTGAYLSGADLRWANLRWAGLVPNLTGANLSGANLRWADLTGADLRGADLTGADLTGADLTGAIGVVAS